MNIDLDASILSDDLVIDWSGYKDWFDTNQNGAWYIPKGEKTVTLRNPRPVTHGGIDYCSVDVAGVDTQNAPIQCLIPLQFVGVKLGKLSNVIQGIIDQIMK